jgi:hypothetical protein
MQQPNRDAGDGQDGNQDRRVPSSAHAQILVDWPGLDVRIDAAVRT